ncbi:hypothetical protein SADUNF_Sadunf05G0142000 [Salix dunnii]|uniref:Uncharacterized protein n=1 Tax=Salix dunnii TaxID=1413687 RepID=A0A835MZC3_9ROSI|nr:hypothetical protein SADUNF_Sadunf05G0142000 [Salix dunnii]
MEKHGEINNCEECGMLNGTLGLRNKDLLFRFLLCNSTRSLLAPLSFSHTFEEDEQICTLCIG